MEDLLALYILRVVLFDLQGLARSFVEGILLHNLKPENLQLLYKSRLNHFYLLYRTGHMLQCQNQDLDSVAAEVVVAVVQAAAGQSPVEPDPQCNHLHHLSCYCRTTPALHKDPLSLNYSRTDSSDSYVH